MRPCFVCTDRFLLYRPGISRKGIATPLAHTLWEHGLIDELRLSQVTTLGTGVVVLSYQPVKA